MSQPDGGDCSADVLSSQVCISVELKKLNQHKWYDLASLSTVLGFLSPPDDTLQLKYCLSDE